MTVSFKKTIIFALITSTLGFGIYYFEFVVKEKHSAEKSISDRIFKLKPEEITFFQIKKGDQTISLQKAATGWQIIDPIQDLADQGIMTELINNFSEQKSQRLETSTVNLSEYGLVNPAATLMIKNNQGVTENIKIGTQKNFEGLSFAQINDDVSSVFIVQPIWLTKAEQNISFFREKRLYRENLSELIKIRIKALNDEVVLEKKDQMWFSVKHPEYLLDQNIIRNAIKELAETTIQEYLFEGEPSDKEKKSKGLLKSPVQIEFESNKGSWMTFVKMSEADRALFALTSKPTYLVKLDMSRWDRFANFNLDALRDRKAGLVFSIKSIQKFFAQIQKVDYEFHNENQTWVLKSNLPPESEFSPIAAEKLLNQIHDLQIYEFVTPDVARKFDGKNMVILKSATDQLVFQLNWGPLLKTKFKGIEQEVYLARTQLSKDIFAIEKSKIDELLTNKIFKKNIEKKE